MKRMNCRQILAALFAAVMIFLTPADVFAETGTAQEASQFKASQIYTDDWDQYSTNYYYNQMNDDQRELWDALDAMCLNYLKKKTDMKKYDGSYVTDYVYSKKLSQNDMLMVARIFLYSNPQYYFIEPLFYYSRKASEVGIAMVVYEPFADGSDRAAATKEFKSEINSWLEEIEEYPTDYEKVLAIHDMICDNTDYNYDAVDQNGAVSIAAEQEYLSQSAYSTFCLGTTVCAGYAQACEILCNALGIDAIVVTSKTHEWNKVRIEDSWYNVDCTWDDQGDATYSFFARSDNAYDNELTKKSDHQEESIWNKYLPKCTLDSGSTYSKPGSLPTVTAVTAPVEVNATPIYGQDKDTQKQYIKSYKVSLSCATKGAVIYYTTDGSTPSVASGKSKKYKQAFTLTNAIQLSAIAVCDKKLDSDVTVDERFGAISYTIKYVLNGGKNSKDNPDTYKGTDESFKLKSPTKKGYKFDGWYTDKSFDSDKVTKIKKGSTGKITLYAKWTPITYSVTFDGNGADSGSMKKTEYKYGKSYTLPANKFKRAGYTFVGWNTKKNGKGTTYKNKKEIKNLTAKSGKTITLYAQWKKK